MLAVLLALFPLAAEPAWTAAEDHKQMMGQLGRFTRGTPPAARLANQGWFRKPDDWGVSRYGKAALVTMTFDTRFAMVLIGSSGAGGVMLHRAGAGPHHGMAGNFLEYGSSEAVSGSRNAGDLPADSHQLPALCAPRLTSISYGISEKGGSKWLDQQGSHIAAVPFPADQPAARTDRNSRTAHAQLLEKARRGRIDLYFAGDSITRRWGATDYPALLAGTNNLGRNLPAGGEESKAAEVTQGIQAALRVFEAKAPKAAVILMGILPRHDNPALMPVIARINSNLAQLAGGGKIRFLDINHRLTDRQGQLVDGMMTADKIHPDLRGYQVWADALRPLLAELLGPPAGEDHAPPPTGDPSRDAP